MDAPSDGRPGVSHRLGTVVRMARAVDGAIAELAPKTLGLLTTVQLDDAGVTRQQRRTLVARGTLSPVGPGVLRHVAHPGSWEQDLLAAVLVAGDGAVVSHRAAAALWRFDGVDLGAVEVTVPRHRRPRAVPARVHRTIDLGPADVDQRRGIPCTSATRTFIDLAPLLDPPALEAVLDGGERDGKLWRPRLRWRIGAMRRDGLAGRPGLAAIEALLDRTEGRPLGDTWLEQEALRIVAAARLPAPRVQVKRRHGGGTARVDLYWAEARLVVELAGHATHATRRQRQADDERTARLGLTGWRVVEFTYEDVVERPSYVARMIRSYLDLAA
jgi:very-short-patch-repair endonuclease